MEERTGGIKNHKLTMVNRSAIQMTGINDVLSFDTNEIVLDTEDSLLMIRGDNLHVNHLTLEKGEVNVDGSVDSLVYSSGKKTAKSGEKGLGRWFK